MTNKAQVFLADSMASIAIFSFFVLAFGLVWNVSVEDATNQDNFKQAKGEYTLNILKSEGNPQNWNTSTVQTPGVFEDGKLSRTKFLKLDKIPSSRLRDSLTSSQQFQIQAKYMNGTVLKEDGRNLTVRSTIRQQPDLKQDSLFSISTQNGFNKGSFDSTSADRDNNSGDLGIGYLNGTNSDQPNDVGINNESLVGYWRMDRKSGDVVDYSGLKNDGITRNFDGDERGVNGVFGTKAFEFDGSKQYVDVGPHSYRNFTVSFWAKFDGPVNGDESDMVLSNGNIQSKTDFVQLSTPDTNGFGLRVAIGGDSERITWNRIEETGVSKKLTFFTITKEGRTIEAFYNGTSQGKKTLSSDYKFSIGAIGLGWANNERYSFNGKLDEVKIYNRSLSASEVSQLYLNGRPFTGKYTSKVIDNSESQNWSELEVNASVPSDTDLTATFETLEQGPLQTSQSYASPSEWNLGSFNTTTADNVVVERQNVSMLEASTPSEFNQGEFNKTTSDEVVTEYKYPSELEASTQSEFNQGSFNGTSADRKDNSGDLGLGYRNGSSGDGLVGYWRFDGSSAKDYSGNGNDGSLNGGLSTQVEGTLSTSAFEFDGSDDYILTPQAQIQGDEIFVSAWVKPEYSGSDYQRVVSAGTYQPWNLVIYEHSNSEWEPYMDLTTENSRQTSNNPIVSKGSNTFNYGDWHYLAGRYNGSEISVWVDGEKLYSEPVSGDLDESKYNDAQYTTIGDRNDGAQNERFRGTMDEVRIYNRSVSKSKVKDLYFNGRPFQGNYTAKEIDNSQETIWDNLEVNASIPSDTSVNATFKALDTNGNLVDSQLIDLSEGLSNYSLSVSNSEDAEVFINGSSSNVTNSWEVYGLEVFSREVEEKNEGLRIGYRNGSAGDNLVGYWRMDRNVGGSGGSVTDYSGNDNDGKSKGSLTTGKSGILSTKTFEFDGDDNYVELADTPNIFSGSEDFTIIAWANHDIVNTGTPQQIITPSADNGFELREDGNSEVIFGWWDGSQFRHGLDFSVSSDKWYYTALTWDADGDVTLYKNGTAKDSTPTDSSPSLSFSTAAIGQKGDGTNWFNGTIDEVRIYNRSLSQSEVKDLYFKGRPFQGSYTAKEIDNSQETKWGSLEVNASIPNDTSVNATFKALDTDGGLVAEQDVDLGEGLNNYSLSVGSSEDAEVVIDGTSSNVTKTWEVHSLEVYSSEVVDRNDGLRIGYGNSSADDSLVGYWRMDRNISKGGLVRDYSGNNADATYNGVESGSEGVFSTKGVRFDGQDDKIEAEGSSSLEFDGTHEVAASAWVKRTGDVGGGCCGTIVGQRDIGNWVLRVDERDSQVEFIIEPEGWAGDSAEYGHELPENEWHHLAGSYNGTHNSLYYDGELIYRIPGLSEGNFGPGTETEIAGAQDGHFQGLIDEVRVYNRSISQEKVEDLYFNGRNGGFNGSYTAEKIDKAQETIWNKLEVNASVPSQTSVDARFNVLDSQGGLVDSQVISLDDGRRNYSLDVKASKNARLNFNGTSSNVTKTWKIQNFEVYSSEYQVKQSQNLNVLEGSNEYLLGVGQSKAARVGFKGSSTDVQETWSIESFSVLNTSSYGSTQTDLNLSKQESYNQGEFNGTSTDRRNNSGTLGIGYLNGTKSGQTNDNGLNNGSLVGYWRLDGDVSGSGGTVKDYSGYGNNGKTQNGISSGSEGVFSTNSFQSEEGGDIEFVNVSHDTSLDITEEVTMSAWINLESDASDYWRIVQKGQNTAYEIYMQSGDTYPVLRINNAINLEAPSIQTSDWTLVTATYDASTDNASIYLDGSLEATTIQDVGNIGTNDNPLRIGTREQKDTSIDGKIDEVRIYDRALSPKDIRDLYFNGKPFQGNYTAKRIDKNRETSWNNLEVDASVPSQTSVNVTFESLDSSNNVIGSQEIVIKDGLKNYSLQTGVSENAEVSVQGTSSDVTKTWEIRDIQVFGASKKSEERVSQIPENKSIRTFRSLALDAKTDKRVQLSFYRWSS